MQYLDSAPNFSLSERHRELVGELEAIFLAEGFRSITIGSLASRLKCSRRTLYEIAPSKQEIFLIVVGKWLRRLQDVSQAKALKAKEPKKRMETYLSSGTTMAAAASPAFLADVASYRPARELFDEYRERRAAVLRDIVEEGESSGQFRSINTELIIEIFILVATRFNDPAFLRKLGVDHNTAFTDFYELILHGLIKKPA